MCNDKELIDKIQLETDNEWFDKKLRQIMLVGVIVLFSALIAGIVHFEILYGKGILWTTQSVN